MFHKNEKNHKQQNFPEVKNKKQRYFAFPKTSKNCKVALHPFAATTARSEVTSFTGITGLFCFVNMKRPSKNGGTTFCTNSVTRFSSDSSSRKSSSSVSDTTPQKGCIQQLSEIDYAQKFAYNYDDNI